MKTKIVMAVIALASCPALPVYADNAQSQVEKIVDICSASGSSDSLAESLSKHIDFADMAQLAAGEYWPKLTGSEKTQLIQLISQLVREDYYPRWHKLFKTGKVKIDGADTSGNDTVVKTTLTIGKKNSFVNWRMHPHEGEMQVLSLSVGEKDLLANMQKRFQTKLHAAGFQGLIAWLKGKLDRQDADDQMASELR